MDEAYGREIAQAIHVRYLRQEGQQSLVKDVETTASQLEELLKHSHNQAEKACRKSVVRARSLVLRHPFKSLPNFGLAEWGVKLGQVRRLEERCKVQGEVAHNLSTEQPLKVGESLRSHAVHVRDQGVTTLQTEDPIFLAMEGGVQYGRKMCCRRRL